MFCFVCKWLQLVFVVELCNTHFRQYHLFQFVWVFTFYYILYYRLCILEQTVIVWLIKKWCWKKCCSTKSCTSHMSVSFCWRWNYTVKPACIGTARDQIFFSVAGRFHYIQVLEFELKDFVELHASHISLSCVQCWHGFNHIIHTFYCWQKCSEVLRMWVDQEAWFSGCILVLPIVSTVKNYFDVVKFMHVLGCFQSITV